MYRDLWKKSGHGISFAFADDGDTGNIAVNDPLNGGGGGGTPPTPPTPPKGETFTIKVNGVEQTLTKDELLRTAEKAAGADEKFRQAAEAKKQAEKGLRIQDLFGKVQSGKASDEELHEFGGLLGMDVSDIEDLKPKPKTPPKTPPATPTKEDIANAVAEILGTDPQDVRETLALAKKSQLKEADALVRKTAGDAVDKDEIIGKIIEVNKEASPELRDTLVDMAVRDLFQRITNGEKFESGTVQQTLQALRATLKKLGIPNKKMTKPAMLGFGPSGNLPEEIYADEPIKRTPSNEPGWLDNLVKRTLQKQAKS